MKELRITKFIAIAAISFVCFLNTNLILGGVDTNNNGKCFSEEGGKMEIKPLPEDELIEIAKLEAKKINFSLAGHTVATKVVNSQIEVSFYEPTKFGGGITVVIDKSTGEVLNVWMDQ